jgi:hypothetical protein
MKRIGLVEQARAFRDAITNDAELWLKGARAQLDETGNPYFAWTAIKVCIEHDRKFPEWVKAYLALCAERMDSDEAKEGGRDLRKVLPWIFGFPNVLDPTKRKHGPGNLLNPDGGNPDLMSFALKFAIKLEQGEKVSAAVRNACNETLSGKTAEVDDKTLRRWLQKEFGLRRQPSNADGWKKAARHHFLAFGQLYTTWKDSRETVS